MKTTEIKILNLSCKGCVNTIIRNLSAIEGVDSVSVDLETDIFSIIHDGSVERQVFSTKLFSLGYPEENSENAFITKLKSKKSCLTGRIMPANDRNT